MCFGIHSELRSVFLIKVAICQPLESLYGYSTLLLTNLCRDRKATCDGICVTVAIQPASARGDLSLRLLGDCSKPLCGFIGNIECCMNHP